MASNAPLKSESTPDSTPTSTPSRPVVLVTGAARRIGREIALHLAANGWDVALHYRHSSSEAQTCAAAALALGARTECFAADLADDTQCEALVPQVLARMGRLDAVVNNASLFEHDDVHSFTSATLERHWRANTAPAIVLARALHAVAHEAGAVVVNLLDQKLWNLNPDHLSYTLSKAALQCATTMLAMALAPKVRVCGVAPGLTLLSGDMNRNELHAAVALNPLQRSSTPQDVARTVRFLLESPSITGTTVLVDGGQHLVAQPRDVMFMVRAS